MIPSHDDGLFLGQPVRLWLILSYNSSARPIHADQISVAASVVAARDCIQQAVEQLSRGHSGARA
jgi:hypothetical protein